MLVLVVAAGMRFWQLGDLPPGLYRDEGANGLDALAVLDGEHFVYFVANNGREPAYIYLTAIAISVLGRTPLAVRLAAAVAGTLTTWLTYRLASSWFGLRVGLMAAWVWAVTFWPVQLSRIGLRPILLPLTLALALYLGTQAYRRRRGDPAARWYWLAGGLAYSVAFYTYVPVRATPLLLLLLLIYLRVHKRSTRLWPGLGWAASGAVVAVAPLAVFAAQQPELFFGRAGQVSILDPDAGLVATVTTLWQQTARTLGMFFVQGDPIWRHNLHDRPVFDLFLAGPFVAGVAWCLVHWRKTPAATLVLWSAVMLGPTILAEDAPHFLRAAGALPAITVLPALGLSRLWTWNKLPGRLRRFAVIVLLLASTAKSIRDYFVVYGRQPETATWFESAARELAEDLLDEPAGVTLLVDERYWQGWPSVPFLLGTHWPGTLYSGEEDLSNLTARPLALYAWPHEPLDGLLNALPSPSLVTAQTGALAQGDLDPQPYPLWVRYGATEAPDWPAMAVFDNSIQLRHAEMTELAQDQLMIDLYWSSASRPTEPLTAFVHVVDEGGITSQDDSIPGQGNWPSQYWRPGLIVHDRHILDLQAGAGLPGQRILIGLVNASTNDRLPVQDANGNDYGDVWQLWPSDTGAG